MQNKTIKPRNYLYEFLVFIILIALWAIWWFVLGSALKAGVAGYLTYLILAWSLRFSFQKHHRKGMAYLRAKNYNDALRAFKRSFDYFEKHPFIDKYRFITMFSSSAIPYGQMALNNMGVCYLHIGDARKALDVLQKLADLNSNIPHISETIEKIKLHINESENR